MSKISLRHLALENFRTFSGRHEIQLPESGLVIVKGRNLETRGESGAGKTNILLAIAYLLGYCRLSVSALRNWEAEGAMRVVGTFESDVHGQIRIERSDKGSKLSLTIGDQSPVSGSVKEVEAEINKLFGVSDELRQILTYRDQEEPQRFMDMSDSAMKAFLTVVLGIQPLEQEIDAATLRITATSSKLEKAQILLAERERSLTAAKTMTSTLPQIQDLRSVKRDLESVKTQLVAATARKQKLADDLAATVASEAERASKIRESVSTQAQEMSEKASKANKLLNDLLEKDREESAAYARETKKLFGHIASLKGTLREVEGHRKRSAALRLEIEKLEMDSCPVCERPWLKAHDLVEEKRVQAAEADAKVAAAADIENTIKVMEEEISVRAFASDPRIEQLRGVREKLLQAIAFVESSAKSQSMQALLDPERASATLNVSLHEATEEVSELSFRQRELKSLLAEKVRANEAIERQRTEQLQTLFNLEQDLEAARAQATEYQDVENREVDCLGLLKGFRNKIFDEVLQAIGAEATAIIASMPNAQHLGVEFRSERETKKAAVQERITPIVTVYGVERNPKEALSGGQRTSLNLAVDLAIIRVVSARLGCNLNWVVFDESFNGHDPVTKASCLEMLQQYATSKLVIIVDHTSEFKELFSSVITVEYDNKESKIA